MKYCTKCGYQLIDEARFCNACGAPAEPQTQKASFESENPYASEANTYSAPQYTASQYTNEPKSEEELRAEEQALLDKFSIGLKHERMAWKFTGIFYLVGTIFFTVFGLIFGIAAIGASGLLGEELAAFATIFSMYIFMGIGIYLPVTIINFSMKNKLEKYREKLYTDCRDGIGHFSVGSIVFCAFFNGVALVFNIVYFIQAKRNSAVIERIKAQQDSYNSQI